MYPPELHRLRAAVRSAASHTYSCAPAPMQYAIAHALQDIEACEEYIAHTTRIMKAVALYCFKCVFLSAFSFDYCRLLKIIALFFFSFTWRYIYAHAHVVVVATKYLCIRHVANTCTTGCSELTSLGVQCVTPTAGYYCFPNFERWREVFKKRGITTGTQMCDVMLNECKAAVSFI